MKMISSSLWPHKMQLEIVSLMYVITIGTNNMQHRSPRLEFYIMIFENVFTRHS